MRIAALAATLSDWTDPDPGIVAISSHALRVAGRSPSSSLPNTKANGRSDRRLARATIEWWGGEKTSLPSCINQHGRVSLVLEMPLR